MYNGPLITVTLAMGDHDTLPITQPCREHRESKKQNVGLYVGLCVSRWVCITILVCTRSHHKDRKNLSSPHKDRGYFRVTMGVREIGF